MCLQYILIRFTPSIVPTKFIDCPSNTFYASCQSFERFFSFFPETLQAHSRPKSFNVGNSLLWEAALCIVSRLAVSIAFILYVTVAFPVVTTKDVSNH
jgi:hypothetical protein